MRRFFGVVFAVALFACGGPVDEAVASTAQVVEPRHLFTSNANHDVVQSAVDAWVLACGDVVTLDSSSGAVEVSRVSRATMTERGADTSDVGLTSEGHIAIVDYLTEDRLLHAMAHEIGHALGHGHVTGRVSVMNAYEDQQHLIMPTAADCY